MFYQKIDDKLQLVFLHQAFAEELYDLVDQNRNHLSTWLAFPPMTKSVDDIRAFIQRSVSGFGDEKTMIYGKPGLTLEGIITITLLNSTHFAP